MLNWDSILLESGINVPANRDEFNMSCPFHSDVEPSLSLNLEKGVWICHAGCGQGGLKGFLAKYLKISCDALDEILLSKQLSFDLNMFDVDDSVESVQISEMEFPYEMGYVPEWIFDRGFEKKTLSKWRCAVDLENSLVIPVFEEQKVIGWITRRLYMTPKYLYSKGFKKSLTLFGNNHVTPQPFVCVTEGSLDTMWLDQYGYTAVALLGANASVTQQELLLNLPTTEIVLCLDNDEAGKIATEKILTTLSQKCIVSTIQIPKGYKDVQDIRDTQILHSVLKNRTLW